MSLRDRIRRIRISEWDRYLSWAVVALIVIARLANFWGLHYGNTDDIAIDYRRMTMPLWSMANTIAFHQARIQYFLTIPLWTGMLSLAGTPWYDVLNLGSFALGALLPPFALRRYYFPGNAWMLYAVAFFAPLPLLFSYVPPYSYPLYTSFPLVACAVAVFLFQGSQSERSESPGARMRLAAGAMATFLAVCTYEPAAVLSIVILGAYFAASHSGRPWRTLLERRDLRYAAGAIACFGGLYFGFRAAYPPVYAGVTLSTAFLSLASVTRVVGTLSLTSSVYAWFTTPQLVPHPVPLAAAISLGRATISEIALALLTAAIVLSWIILARRNAAPSSPFRLAVLAFFLLFAPNAIYALVPKIASLVVSEQLYAYTATSQSHIGFACAFAALALASARIPAMPLRVLSAGILAVFAGFGSFAASGFNRESAVFAREQAARWTVIRYLAACSAQIPTAYLQNLAAPGMWNVATARLSWAAHDEIDDLYWDALAFSRYSLYVHPVREPGAAPFHQLDFRLEKDGSLESVILARSAAGKRFEESWVIPAKAGAAWQSGTAGASSIVPCRDGLDALHLTGGGLELGTFTPIEPSARPSDTIDSAKALLEPRSGRGSDQIFRVSLPEEQGEAVRTVGLLVNGSKTGFEGCFVFWDLMTHQNRLVKDGGLDSYGPSSPGGFIENRQCALLTDGTTYNSDGKAINLTFHVKFRDTFKGLKHLYLFRNNTKGETSGLNRVGWWWVE